MVRRGGRSLLRPLCGHLPRRGGGGFQERARGLAGGLGGDGRIGGGLDEAIEGGDTGLGEDQALAGAGDALDAVDVLLELGRLAEVGELLGGEVVDVAEGVDAEGAVGEVAEEGVGDGLRVGLPAHGPAYGGGERRQGPACGGRGCCARMVELCAISVARLTRRAAVKVWRCSTPALRVRRGTEHTGWNCARDRWHG